MQINNYNNQNFKSIKLSNNSFEHVRDVAMYLERTGFDCLGHKTIYTSNTAGDKYNALKNVREKSGFYDKEFGAIIFPWSKEAYIMASRETEQFMFPVVKNVDEGAELNLFM